jgi:hypothetical protein
MNGRKQIKISCSGTAMVSSDCLTKHRATRFVAGSFSDRFDCYLHSAMYVVLYVVRTRIRNTESVRRM